VEVIACDNLDLAAANGMDSANNRTDVVHSSADESLKKVTALFLMRSIIEYIPGTQEGSFMCGQPKTSCAYNFIYKCV
jgi:hypothetical protein